MLPASAPIVGVGSCVTVRDLRNHEEFDLTIVGSGSVRDPDCIAVGTPIAEALVGARVHDIVSWPTPHGPTDFRVTAIGAGSQS